MPAARSLPTVQNAQKFSEALASNSAGVERFLSAVSDLSGQLGGVSAKLDSTLDAAEKLLRSVDRDKSPSIVNNVDPSPRP